MKTLENVQKLKTIIYKLVNDIELSENERKVIDEIVEKRDYTK